METNKTFKCKDEVIYQSRLRFGEEKLIWNYGIVNYEDEEYVYLVGGLYINKKVFNILPYESNEHLVGTTDEPEEEVKLEEGEIIICSDFSNRLNTGTGVLERYKTINGISFRTHSGVYEYAIRFSDFNPNDMEATKKHILCVKNGKIIRYKG